MKKATIDIRTSGRIIFKCKEKFVTDFSIEIHADDYDGLREKAISSLLDLEIKETTQRGADYIFRGYVNRLVKALAGKKEVKTYNQFNLPIELYWTYDPKNTITKFCIY